MQIHASATKGVDDDFVPANYDELVRVYKTHVDRLVTRYNRVQANFEDITQHVWSEIFARDVLGKYLKSGKPSALPKTMTAKEAIALLGIAWGQWRTMMYYATPAAEKTHPTHYKRHAEGRISPVPVSGTWCSKNAVFHTEDILQLHEIKYFKKRAHFEVPEAAQTRSKFKTYLSTAVHHIFANWCRTRSRRWKDSYLAPHEDGTPWEASIADDTRTTSGVDVHIAVSQALGNVFTDSPERVDDVMSYLKDGYTLVEIAKEMKLSPRLVDRVRTAVLDHGPVSTQSAGSAVAWMMG